MKVVILNRTEYQQFVDLSGKNNPEKIVAIPPKSKIIAEVDSIKVLYKIEKENKNLIVRKIN